jgi:hypothetical protein
MTSLEPFAEDVWIANGPTVRAAGIPFSTRMIVVRLGTGSWWVNSPVPTSRELIDEMTAEGPVKFLVAPTKLHVWRLDSWHALFPEAELWAPPQVPREFKDLPFTGVLGDVPPKTGRLTSINWFSAAICFWTKFISCTGNRAPLSLAISSKTIFQRKAGHFVTCSSRWQGRPGHAAVCRWIFGFRSPTAN